MLLNSVWENNGYGTTKRGMRASSFVNGKKSPNVSLRIGKDLYLCVMLLKPASDGHGDLVTTQRLVSSFKPLLPL